MKKTAQIPDFFKKQVSLYSLGAIGVILPAAVDAMMEVIRPSFPRQFRVLAEWRNRVFFSGAKEVSGTSFYWQNVPASPK